MPLVVWLLLRAHCRYRELLLHLPTLKDTQTHTRTHTWYDSPGRVISPMQRPLPYNTQHCPERDVRAPGGIQTHNPSSKRTVADPRLRPRDHRDRLQTYLHNWNGAIIAALMVPKRQIIQRNSSCMAYNLQGFWWVLLQPNISPAWQIRIYRSCSGIVNTAHSHYCCWVVIPAASFYHTQRSYNEMFQERILSYKGPRYVRLLFHSLEVTSWKRKPKKK